MTRTGADRPASVSVPDVIGVSGDEGGALRPHDAATTNQKSNKSALQN
jgi:hypothetical protein